MVKFKPSNAVCLLDSDVVINWLAQEEDPVTGKKLWEAAHKIIKLVEAGKIKGFMSLINLLEIRFVLRRKKSFDENRIKSDITGILKVLKVAIPDEVNLLKANNLQTDNLLSPFDAMLISVATALEGAVLVSRDKNLLKLASGFLPALTPEDFLARIE
jgi:predicted nucleic acid-binding protein